jgi:hypothetical protein
MLRRRWVPRSSFEVHRITSALLDNGVGSEIARVSESCPRLQDDTFVQEHLDD